MIVVVETQASPLDIIQHVEQSRHYSFVIIDYWSTQRVFINNDYDNTSYIMLKKHEFKIISYIQVIKIYKIPNINDIKQNCYFHQQRNDFIYNYLLQKVSLNCLLSKNYSIQRNSLLHWVIL